MNIFECLLARLGFEPKIPFLDEYGNSDLLDSKAEISQQLQEFLQLSETNEKSLGEINLYLKYEMSQEELRRYQARDRINMIVDIIFRTVAVSAILAMILAAAIMSSVPIALVALFGALGSLYCASSQVTMNQEMKRFDQRISRLSKISEVIEDYFANPSIH